MRETFHSLVSPTCGADMSAHWDNGSSEPSGQQAVLPNGRAGATNGLATDGNGGTITLEWLHCDQGRSEDLLTV